MTTIDRRAMLTLAGGGIALAALPARAAVNVDDAALRAALDSLGPHPEPQAALAALARFDAARLSPGPELDLATVRFGLAIERELAAASPTSPGRYALQLARACGAWIEPERARTRLQSERARVERLAQVDFDRLGLPEGTTGARFAALLARGDGSWSDSEAGRQAAIDWMNRLLDEARADLSRWFGPLPGDCGNVVVRGMTPAELASGKGGYRILPTAGATGAYVVDLRRITARPRWTLASVVHHELLPGHMVQLPLEALAAPHPLRLRFAAGFSEGWAIHAEWLAFRGGLLPDAASRVGALHWRLFRVERALADIAIHHDGWSDATVIAALRERLGFPAYFAPFESDVARTHQAPGPRVAEALTALALDDGVAHARDLRLFHRRMLSLGARPLSWIGL